MLKLSRAKPGNPASEIYSNLCPMTHFLIWDHVIKSKHTDKFSWKVKYIIVLWLIQPNDVSIIVL